jgi:hypothetical protein
VAIVLADAVNDPVVETPQFPSSVTVTRTSEDDFKSRQINISIDGAHAATLLWGDSVTKDLEPGPHRVRFNNTFVWKTIDFTLRPGQQAFFEVINRPGFGTVPMMMVLGVGPLYLTVRRMDS